MSGISKAFPGVQALDGASLSVAAGEIHGLVGENGAGKSTIIKILAGVYARDSGTVTIEGTVYGALSPALVYAAGVRFIHQELHLVPHFTVAESVFMGHEISGRFGIDRKTMNARAAAFLSETLHIDIAPNTLIRNLGIAERKLVQIARALIDNRARIVVFDEPTAPLAMAEIEELFTAIRRLKDSGIAIVYVSHYLGEITQLCDRVTIFRNGKDVAVEDTIGDASSDRIIRHMVGRDLDALYPAKHHAVDAPVLRVSGLSNGNDFNDIDLMVGKGEIVGLGGLIGSGREELTDTIYGLKQPSSGTVELGGQRLRIATPSAAVEAGIVLVPRDRRHDGLVLDLTVGDNVNLASLEEIAKLWLEDRRSATRRSDELAERLDIRPRNSAAITRFLSGGNQQKVVLARWLATGSKVFILDEPTVGVDIGAKVEIYELIEELAAQGAGIIVSSSDPAELIGLCDRVVVLMRGRIIADSPTESLDIDGLIALTTGFSATGDAA